MNSSDTPSRSSSRPGKDTSLFARALPWLFLVGGPLKERVLRGGIWLLLGEGATRVASVVKLAILGRFLSPNDFGLMGIAVAVLKGLEYFTEPGFNAALIRKAGDVRPYLDTAWTVQVLRGLGLGLVVLIGAPRAAQFFGNPDATSIIRAAGLMVMLRGFTNPAVVYLRRELDFRREVMWKLSGAGAGLLVAVPVAIVYRSVWALVLGLIAAQAAETIVSYWAEPYRPRFRLNWARARELTRFGKWIMGANIVAFLGQYIDSLVVAKMLGATALGFYVMALQLALLPARQIGIHVRGVMFPAFAKLQHASDLRPAFLWTLALLSSVLVPLGCVLTVFAEPLIKVILGEQWISIASTLRVLTWAGVAAGVTGFTGELLSAVGKPNLHVRASLLQLIVMAGLLYPLVAVLGITGAGLAVTIATLVAASYQMFLTIQLVRPTAGELLAAVKTGAVGSVPFLGAGILSYSPYAPSVFVVVGLAAGAYAAILGFALRHFRFFASAPVTFASSGGEGTG